MNARGAGTCKSDKGRRVTVNGHRVVQTHKFETGEKKENKKQCDRPGGHKNTNGRNGHEKAGETTGRKMKRRTWDMGTLTKRGCLTFTFSWTSFAVFTFGAFSFFDFVFFPPPSSDVNAVSETRMETGTEPKTRSLVRCVCACTDDRTSVLVLATAVNVSSDSRGCACVCGCGCECG